MKRIIAVLLLGLFATDAAAQMECGRRDAVIAKLSDDYGESRRGWGLAGPATILEVWASSDMGTWTVLVTSPDGTSCIAAAGENWQDDDWQNSALVPGQDL